MLLEGMFWRVFTYILLIRMYARIILHVAAHLQLGVEVYDEK